MIQNLTIRIGLEGIFLTSNEPLEIGKLVYDRRNKVAYLCDIQTLTVADEVPNCKHIWEVIVSSTNKRLTPRNFINRKDYQGFFKDGDTTFRTVEDKYAGSVTGYVVN